MNDNNKKKIIEVRNLTKDFIGVRALSNFSFDLYEGDVHCLIGENGAGKSTFIKILTGAILPSKGDIYIEGAKQNLLNPNITKKLGIQTVYQDGELIHQITVAENIFLGSSEVKQKLFINYKKIFKLAKKLIRELNLNIDAERLYGDLSPSEQQFIKIARSIVLKPKVLILDEPTAVFNINDIELILKLLKELSKNNVSIIFISHHLEEVVKIADKITVLRDGKLVKHHDCSKENVDMDMLAKEMIGRPVELFYKKREHKIGNIIFKVSDLKLKKDSTEINFDLREGEILGVAGLKGSGRTEIMRAIFGADKKYKGDIFFKNINITPKSPTVAVKNGLGLITENKKVDGLAAGRSVAENITMVGLDKFNSPFINLRKEGILAGEYVSKLQIKTQSLDTPVKFLSGGNQQKVAIAKWLFNGTELLIVDEPTIGIDINAKTEVYDLLLELASQGKSIIMISSEMPELISLCDRVLVIRNFEISNILSGDEITEENILLGFIRRK